MVRYILSSLPKINKNWWLTGVQEDDKIFFVVAERKILKTTKKNGVDIR
ncbi:hypothetical protein [Geosporobacter ferrireducens]|nr:hypothetical protein [Geosporobacter ferrireducens]